MTLIGHSEKVLVMRVFLSVLVLIFSLQSWVKADDIRELEIEGMSINQSLLSFMSEDEIKESSGWWYDKKYTQVLIIKDNFIQYDNLVVSFKTGDKDFLIKSVIGYTEFKNINDCHEMQNEIDEDFKEIFKESNRRIDIIKYRDYGNSSTKQIVYDLLSGSVVIDCIDWDQSFSETSDRSDWLNVAIDEKEYRDWLISSS